MEVSDVVNRLSSLRDIKREINALSQRIAELSMQTSPGSHGFLGMPPSKTPGDPTGEIAAKIADMTDMLLKRRKRLYDELARLYEFINDIETAEMRRIMELRYVDGHTWQRVATGIGVADEQYPRRKHNSYIRTLIVRGDADKLLG